MSASPGSALAQLRLGVKDVALSHRMARPSMDDCDDGKLLFFPEATHWIQREEADEVNQHLLDFVFRYCIRKE